MQALQSVRHALTEDEGASPHACPNACPHASTRSAVALRSSPLSIQLCSASSHSCPPRAPPAMRALPPGASILSFGESAAAAAAFGAGTASLSSDPEEALIAAFEAVQAQLEAGAAMPTPLVDARESGACATVAYLREGMLWVAGAGDCTAVLATKKKREIATPRGGYDEFAALQLTTEHKVDHPGEQARIEAAGGTVRPAIYEDGEVVVPARMFEDLKDKRRGPGLAVSRGIGDLGAMRCGLIPTPEVRKHKLDAEADSFLILASDGVWEFISSQVPLLPSSPPRPLFLTSNPSPPLPHLLSLTDFPSPTLLHPRRRRSTSSPPFTATASAPSTRASG